MLFVTANDATKQSIQSRIDDKCSSSIGEWHCGGHGEIFSTEEEKDDHVAEAGRHLIFWVCS